MNHLRSDVSRESHRETSRSTTLPTADAFLRPPGGTRGSLPASSSLFRLLLLVLVHRGAGRVPRQLGFRLLGTLNATILYTRARECVCTRPL